MNVTLRALSRVLFVLFAAAPSASQGQTKVESSYLRLPKADLARIISEPVVPIYLPSAAQYLNKPLFILTGFTDNIFFVEFCRSATCGPSDFLGLMNVRPEEERFECKKYEIVQDTLVCFAVASNNDGVTYYFVKYGRVYTFVGFESMPRARSFVDKLIKAGIVNSDAIDKERIASGSRLERSRDSSRIMNDPNPQRATKVYP